LFARQSPAPASRQSRSTFVADLLILKREVPALVGGEIEGREVRVRLVAMASRWSRGRGGSRRLLELRRVRQEKLLVDTPLLQPPQLRAAGVRLAERDETEDGDEGEQRGDGSRMTP
jgi:hypothetical protein